MADDPLTKRVKEANDIVDVVGTYVALHPAGKKLKGLCPFHDDHRPSFDVDPQFQNFVCWACGKKGDVFTFIQEHEHVSFREALELLARRAGITLKKTADSPPNRDRAAMLDLVKWAERQYHQGLLESPQAEVARKYLGERRLSGETIRRFGLGYAPQSWDWLLKKAAQAGHSAEMLERVGLAAARKEGNGHYDRFRDRVMFPIRDARGQTVGFGGRILPSSPLSDQSAKYINSSETPLFTKSEQLYGLDQARQAGERAGYLTVVEGYTDVLMAHQMGVPQVVATLGTALNIRHIQHLRRFVERVVLVFDADAGGSSGVDRALEVFVSQNVDLAIATLPEGKDPCDFLAEQGAEAFRRILDNAVKDNAANVLDFKLNQLLSAPESSGIEGRRRAVDAVLGIIALAPDMPGAAVERKQELVVNHIGHRLGLQEKLIWARLKELKASRRNVNVASRPREPAEDQRQAAAPAIERQLLELLLANPNLVPMAAAEVTLAEVADSELRQLLEGLYIMQATGETPDVDQLRARMGESRLAQLARELHEKGRQHFEKEATLQNELESRIKRLIEEKKEALEKRDSKTGALKGDRADELNKQLGILRNEWIRKASLLVTEVLAEFRRKRAEPLKEELHNQLQAAGDHTEAVELLRRLQQQSLSVEAGDPPLCLPPGSGGDTEGGAGP